MAAHAGVYEGGRRGIGAENDATTHNEATTHMRRDDATHMRSRRGI
jgi:hypothetical protein